MELQKNLKLCLHGTMAFSSLCLSGTVCGGKIYIYEKQKAQPNANAGTLCNITN